MTASKPGDGISIEWLGVETDLARGDMRSLVEYVRSNPLTSQRCRDVVADLLVSAKSPTDRRSTAAKLNRQKESFEAAAYVYRQMAKHWPKPERPSFSTYVYDRLDQHFGYSPGTIERLAKKHRWKKAWGDANKK